MAKKHKHPEHVNHERWLVSYADFVTLLFAFFVVMFAVGQVDSKKTGRFSQSFRTVSEFSIMGGQGHGISKGGIYKVMPQRAVQQPGPKSASDPAKKPRNLEGGGGAVGKFGHEKWRIEEALLRNLGDVAFDGVAIMEMRGELIVRLSDRMLFPPGEATLSPEGYMALEIIAAELRDRPVRLRVEGHTDDTPTDAKKFKNSWEMSIIRATQCVRFYLENKRFDAGRLSAAGYGPYRPVAPNTTAEGRAKNRRVEIVVMPDVGLEVEVP